MAEQIGVAEAKRRFSELIERVKRGDRFVVSRRGKPALALVPPSEVEDRREGKPVGLAAIAGGLADWEDMEEVVAGIYRARRTAKDRPVPEIG